MTNRPSIAVVGGGVTGLTAARRAARDGDARVILLESSGSLGGKIASETRDGVLYEAGADSFLARDPRMRDLCEDLGIEGALVEPAVFGAALWIDGLLRRLAPGSPYGIPVSPMKARETGSLSLGGALRAYGDLVLPGPLRGPDISVGGFVSRRFGSETLAHLIDPLLAGTRAGDPHAMSLAAALPALDSLARSNRSVIRAFRRAQRTGELESGPPPFLGFKDGMGMLIDALRREVEPHTEMHTNARVVNLGRDEKLVINVADGREIVADAAILTTPAFVTASVVRVIDEETSDLLNGIEYASIALITFEYAAGSAIPPEGCSGVLVPSSETATINACTFFSHKWPGSAPEDRDVVRAFVGRAGADPALALEDRALVDAVRTDLSRIAAIDAEPLAVEVVRLDRAIPQYAVGHLERVERIERALHPQRVAVAGAGFRGSGIPDCIAQGVAAAERALGWVEARGREPSR